MSLKQSLLTLTFAALSLLSFSRPLAAATSFKSAVLEKTCESLIASDFSDAFIEAENAPGLLMLDGAMLTSPIPESEMASAILYAKMIYESHGERLVFIPEFETLSTPGFDGFIIDATGHVVANFTLKTLPSNAKSERLQGRLAQSIEHAQKYSHFESWLNEAANMEPGSWGSSRKKQRQQELLEQASRFLARAMSLFAIPINGSTLRPYRIVIDASAADSALPTQESLQAIDKRLRLPENRNIAEVVILKKQAPPVIMQPPRFLF